MAPCKFKRKTQTFCTEIEHPEDAAAALEEEDVPEAEDRGMRRRLAEEAEERVRHEHEEWYLEGFEEERGLGPVNSEESAENMQVPHEPTEPAVVVAYVVTNSIRHFDEKCIRQIS